MNLSFRGPSFTGRLFGWVFFVGIGVEQETPIFEQVTRLTGRLDYGIGPTLRNVQGIVTKLQERVANLEPGNR